MSLQCMRNHCQAKVSKKKRRILLGLAVRFVSWKLLRKLGRFSFRMDRRLHHHSWVHHRLERRRRTGHRHLLCHRRKDRTRIGCRFIRGRGDFGRYGCIRRKFFNLGHLFGLAWGQCTIGESIGFAWYGWSAAVLSNRFHACSLQHRIGSRAATRAFCRTFSISARMEP